MDFLDSKKQRRHTIMLYAGYILIAIAILISTIVLVYQANGFGVNSKGQVVQNGLVFFSSQPSAANIYLNDHKNDSQTNSRISVPAGQYSVRLSRPGYRDWLRNITVQGGDVQHFDYPLLFPTNLVTKAQANYKVGTGFASQSRDHRWLVVQPTVSSTTFDVYDLKDDNAASTSVALSAAVIRGPLTGNQSWTAVQWSDDNVHLVLKHNYDGGSEYIELNRDDPTKSVNLSQAFGTTPADLALIDNKYDRFNLLSATGDLSTASLSDPTPVKILGSVINYKSYGSKVVLYATSTGAIEGKVNIDLFDGTTSHLIRQVSAGTSYLLEMAGFGGKPYVVLGASSENIVYIYQDPLGQLSDSKVKQPAALRAIKVNSPTYVSFSPNTQYIMAENGNQFGIYDIYLKHSYAYTVKSAFDAPQLHAAWMDGNRLTYASNGKTLVFDYDHRNVQSLMAQNPSYNSFFRPDYHYVYTLAPTDTGDVQLSKTALLTAADL